MRGRARFGAAILAAAIGAACAPGMNLRIDQQGDLAGYRTWSFLPLRGGSVRASASDARALDATLTRLVERCLQERGFAQVNDRPDFYVSYVLEVRRQRVVVMETPASDYLYSMNDSPSYEVQATKHRVEIHEMGSLTIFVTDPDERAVLWRGGFAGEFRGAISPYLRSAVPDLLALLPASGASGGAEPSGACASRL